jgi:acetylornithine deacetylase/succinyl-diaminopimelate desuccinylase-like protein
VIPSEAEAYLDIRALPDEDMTKFYAEIRRVIGDPKVEVVGPDNATRPMGAPSRIDNEMFRALEAVGKRMFPGSITLPAMLNGATDLAQLRARGVEAYGIGPIADEHEAPGGGAHGDDERLEETSLHKLVEYLWRAVIEIAASRN